VAGHDDQLTGSRVRSAPLAAELRDEIETYLATGTTTARAPE
jgi:hypothetical protein